MTQWMQIIGLFLIGMVLVVADLFLPSHFVLSLTALGVFGYTLYKTFQISVAAGWIFSAILAVSLPALLVAFLRIWPRTWLGRRVLAPNPVLTDKDRLPVSDLQRLIGCVGRSLSPLRPVGMCLFDGQRVECVAETGMLEPNVTVEGIRLTDRTLVVRGVSSSREA